MLGIEREVDLFGLKLIFWGEFQSLWTKQKQKSAPDTSLIDFHMKLVSVITRHTKKSQGLISGKELEVNRFVFNFKAGRWKKRDKEDGG